MIVPWLIGLVRTRGARLAGIVAGVAATVALLASVGAFLGSAESTMTRRAASNVVVDWQVQVARGADTRSATAIVRAAAGVRRVLPVSFGRATALSAASGGSRQRTGTAAVLGLPEGYTAAFPGQIRPLTGAPTGVLLAQQAAANLHAAPGGRVAIILGRVQREVRVAGVIDLPQADTLFQTVGAPIGAQPTAPPDNVVLLPRSQFDQLYQGRPDLVTTQLHVARSHDLPADPAEAYTAVSSAANNLTARLAGAGIVGNNLAAALDAARSDASYANVLFLFLGLPGAVLAALLTLVVAATDRQTRRRDQALLRLRGAPRAVILRLAAAEGALLAFVGCLIGLLAAQLIGTGVFGFGPLAAVVGPAAAWPVSAVILGAALALLAVVVPTLHDLRATTVIAAGRQVSRPDRPWWTRYFVDLLLIVVGVAFVLVTTQEGYSVVLAPEGVPTVNVNYWAFVGPAALWLGGALLVWRLVDLLLTRRRAVAHALRPFSGGLAGVAAATLSRQRGLLARSSTLLAAAVAFAISTSVFNATYQQQAEVDARLTNGADVRVTSSTTAPAGDSVGPRIDRTSGVRHVEPLQHRYAYVGADLQDLYGVDARTVRAGTSLQDAYFSGGTAAQLLARLAATPDAVLVSQETARDYQLKMGDHLTLRLPTSAASKPVPVRFTYVGQALEFPTAPRDSFLIANAGYVGQQTGDRSANTFLVTTDGTAPSVVAARLQHRLAAAARVTPIGIARSTVGSSLTSVDLAGLTRVELAFALLLGAASGGLVLLLGLAQRRSTFAVLAVLGSTRRQSRALPTAEGAVTLAFGLIFGTALGAVLANVLVAVLTGVFDPPPAALTVPWAYLGMLAAITVAGIGVVSLLAGNQTRRPAVESLRES